MDLGLDHRAGGCLAHRPSGARTHGQLHEHVSPDRFGARALKPVQAGLGGGAQLQILQPSGEVRQRHHEQNAEHGEADHDLHDRHPTLYGQRLQHRLGFFATQQLVAGVDQPEPAGTATVVRVLVSLIEKLKPAML